MPSVEDTHSPLAATTDLIEEQATVAFERLGNETRLAILLALWEATVETDTHPTDAATLSFTELRNRVGVQQGSQFNYHLDKLVDTFVRKTDAGYQLHPAGEQLIHTVIATAGFDDPTLETTNLDLPCPNCNAPTALTYHNHRLYHVCTNCSGQHDLSDAHPDGVLEAWLTNPAVLTHGTASEMFTARKTTARFQYGLRVAGICPDCTGRIDTEFSICHDHPPNPDGACPHCGHTAACIAEFECSVCHDTSLASVTSLILKLAPPPVAAFYHDHGIDIGYQPLDLDTRHQLQALATDAETTVHATDPLEITITIRYAGDTLTVTVDDTLTVVTTDTST